MSKEPFNLASTIDRLVYPGLGIVLCQSGDEGRHREASAHKFQTEAGVSWVTLVQEREASGSYGLHQRRGEHATRLEALQTLVVDGFHQIVEILQ